MRYTKILSSFFCLAIISVLPGTVLAACKTPVENKTDKVVTLEIHGFSGRLVGHDSITLGPNQTGTMNFHAGCGVYMPAKIKITSDGKTVFEHNGSEMLSVLDEHQIYCDHIYFKSDQTEAFSHRMNYKNFCTK